MNAPAEPPVGTWVIDRWGGTSRRANGGGWGSPGFMSLASWEPMWNARGPLEVCEPWAHDRCLSPSPNSNGLCTRPKDHADAQHSNPTASWAVQPTAPARHEYHGTVSQDILRARVGLG